MTVARRGACRGRLDGAGTRVPGVRRTARALASRSLDEALREVVTSRRRATRGARARGASRRCGRCGRELVATVRQGLSEPASAAAPVETDAVVAERLLYVLAGVVAFAAVFGAVRLWRTACCDAPARASPQSYLALVTLGGRRVRTRPVAAGLVVDDGGRDGDFFTIPPSCSSTAPEGEYVMAEDAMVAGTIPKELVERLCAECAVDRVRHLSYDELSASPGGRSLRLPRPVTVTVAGRGDLRRRAGDCAGRSPGCSSAQGDRSRRGAPASGASSSPFSRPRPADRQRVRAAVETLGGDADARRRRRCHPRTLSEASLGGRRRSRTAAVIAAWPQGQFAYRARRRTGPGRDDAQGHPPTTQPLSR